MSPEVRESAESGLKPIDRLNLAVAGLRASTEQFRDFQLDHPFVYRTGGLGIQFGQAGQRNVRDDTLFSDPHQLRVISTGQDHQLLLNGESDYVRFSPKQDQPIRRINGQVVIGATEDGLQALKTEEYAKYQDSICGREEILMGRESAREQLEEMSIELQWDDEEELPKIATPQAQTLDFDAATSMAERMTQILSANLQMLEMQAQISSTEAPKEKAKNAEAVAHAKRIADKLELPEDEMGKKKKIIDVVFADAQINKDFDGMLIRGMTMKGEVVRELYETCGLNGREVGLMAIGDINLPDFMRETNREIAREAQRIYGQFLEKYGTGYDLTAKSPPEAREKVMDLFDRYYGFSDHPGLKEKLTDQMCLIQGGMVALDFIAVSLTQMALDQGKTINFKMPDNSFGTEWAITKWATYGLKKELGERDVISTEQTDLLHMTPEKIRQHYKDKPNDGKHLDVWYLTPVGNPSGTMIAPEQLAASCEAIMECNPEAVIILDCVYVRILGEERAKELMEGVLENEKARKQIIFVESFSKSHGICGERVGSFFTENKALFTQVRNYNNTMTAGNGIWTAALQMAIAGASEGQNAKIKQMHELFTTERRGLFNYLMQPKFAHLFEKDQSHITNEQLRNPVNLYLFPRIKPGVTTEQILLETGCLGVIQKDPKFNAGEFIRFSVGQLGKPKYSQFAEPEKFAA